MFFHRCQRFWVDFINGIQFWKKVRLRSKNRLFVRCFFFVSNKKVKAFLESARLRWMFNRTITAKEKLKTFLPQVWCRTKLKHSKFLWFMEELQRNLNSNSSHEFFEKCCDKHFTGSDSRPKTHLSRQKKKKKTPYLYIILQHKSNSKDKTINHSLLMGRLHMPGRYFCRRHIRFREKKPMHKAQRWHVYFEKVLMSIIIVRKLSLPQRRNTMDLPSSQPTLCLQRATGRLDDRRTTGCFLFDEARAAAPCASYTTTQT